MGRSTPTLCPRCTPTPSHLLVFLPPPSCSPRPSCPPLPSSTCPPPMLPSPPSSVASQSLPLPLLPPPLLLSPPESRWPKRETRPVEVQKQRNASYSHNLTVCLATSAIKKSPFFKKKKKKKKKKS